MIFSLYCTKEVSLCFLKVCAQRLQTLAQRCSCRAGYPHILLPLGGVCSTYQLLGQTSVNICLFTLKDRSSAEERALGYSAFDDEGSLVYRTIIVAWAFNPEILEMTLRAGGTQRLKKKRAGRSNSCLKLNYCSGFLSVRFPYSSAEEINPIQGCRESCGSA